MGSLLRGARREACLCRAYRHRHEPPRSLGGRGGPGREGSRALVGADTLSGDEPSRLRRRAAPSQERRAAKHVRPASRAAPRSALQVSPTPPASCSAPHYCYEMVRPGIAIYGGQPARVMATTRSGPWCNSRVASCKCATSRRERPSAMARPARLRARRGSPLSAVGYADGFFRALSIADGEEGFAGYLGPHAAPIVGRVSMDLIALDVSRVPEELAQRGAWVELIGPNVPAHDARRIMPAPSTTRSSPISAGAPSGAMSEAEPSHGQSLASLRLPSLRRGHQPLVRQMRLLRRVELDHRGSGRRPGRPD